MSRRMKDGHAAREGNPCRGTRRDALAPSTNDAGSRTLPGHDLIRLLERPDFDDHDVALAA